MEEESPVTVEVYHDHMYINSSPTTTKNDLPIIVTKSDSPRKQPAIIKISLPPKLAATLAESKKLELSAAVAIEPKPAEQPAPNNIESQQTEEQGGKAEEHRCAECGKTYEHGYSLKRHMLVQHSGDARPFACEQCGKTFKMNSNLLQHMRGHTGERGHECAFCGKHFDTSYSWKKHELTHILNGAKNECNVCSSRFPSRQALQKHRADNNCKAETYVCCKITYAKKRDYLMHRIQSHPQKKNRYSCTSCEKTFPFSYMLAIHQKSHDVPPEGGRRKPGPRPPGAEVKCGVCSESFTDQRALLAHSFSAHKDDKPFVCKICNKGTTTKFAMQRHERMHANERPFQCDYCEKAFLDAESRRAHRRIHTGEKPYECRFCDRRFSRTGNLQSHLFTHTGEKPFACPICDRGFAQHATLKGHMKTHGYLQLPARKRTNNEGTEEFEEDKTSRELRRLLLGARETKKAISSISNSREEEENVIETHCEYELDDNIIIVMQ